EGDVGLGLAPEGGAPIGVFAEDREIAPDTEPKHQPDGGRNEYKDADTGQRTQLHADEGIGSNQREGEDEEPEAGAGRDQRTRATWVWASRQKAAPRLAYSRRIERSLQTPSQSISPMAVETSTRMPIRGSGRNCMRMRASAATSAKAKTRSQKPAPGETRAIV